MNDFKLISDLESFQPWSGAEQVWDDLSNSEIERLGAELEMLYPDGLTDTQLNDILRFDQAFVYRLIGRPMPLDCDSTQITFDFDFNSWEDILKHLEISGKDEMQDKFEIIATAEVDDEFHSEEENTEFDLIMTYGTEKDGSFSIEVIDEYDQLWDDASARAIAYPMWNIIEETCGSILPWDEKAVCWVSGEYL